VVELTGAVLRATVPPPNTTNDIETSAAAQNATSERRQVPGGFHIAGILILSPTDLFA
jgi:hypothetical protein